MTVDGRYPRNGSNVAGVVGMLIGIQTSLLLGKEKPSGITPTISYRALFSGIVVPMTSRPPKSLCQSAQDSTTTFVASALPSVGAIVRPRAARTPIVSKKSPDTTPATTRRGRSGSARLSPPEAYAATLGKTSRIAIGV